MIDLLKYRYVYFLISALIILPGLVFLALGGLKPGIDFTGGSELTVLLPRNVHTTIGAVQSVVSSVAYQGHAGYLSDSQVQQVQGIGNQQEYLIRTRDIGANVAVQNSLLGALRARYGNVQTQGFQSVGSTIGAQTTTRAVQAVIVAAIAILLYMAWAFRKLAHPFVYGGAAIAALLHDVLVVLGLFAIMGYFFNIRVDSTFVPAVLTVIGFSVHDTIVVFDRIRENAGRRTGEPYYTVVNNSLLQTLGRSLNTSLTVLLTLAALLLFGGSSIHIFVLALLIGIASGTYSSIFNATPLAVIWETGELPGLFGGGKKREPSRPAAVRTRPVETARSSR
jgi:preprotein translocase subunit SecF